MLSILCLLHLCDIKHMYQTQMQFAQYLHHIMRKFKSNLFILLATLQTAVLHFQCTVYFGYLGENILFLFNVKKHLKYIFFYFPLIVSKNVYMYIIMYICKLTENYKNCVRFRELL